MKLDTIRYTISSRESVNNQEAAEYISKFTKCALSTAVRGLSNGKEGFFYTDDLSFEENRKSHALKTRRFINGLIKRNIDPFIIGIVESQDWYDVKNPDDFEVEVNDVLDQLNEFAKEL